MPESNPTILDNAVVGFVLGGFLTDFKKNEKTVFAEIGLEENVIEPLIVLPTAVHVTELVNVEPEHAAEDIVYSGGIVNYIMSPVFIAMLD